MSIFQQAASQQLAAASANAVPLSQSDTVRLTQSERDAPGTYVSADQQRQDAYAQQLLIQDIEQRKLLDMRMQQQQQMASYPGPATMYAGNLYSNPNYQITRGSTAAEALPDGTIIYR